MFAKLLKHEWKANVGLLCLLSGCALGLGCIAAVILRLLTGNWDAITESDTGVLLMIPCFFFLFAAFLGIMLYSACVQYILLYRFYKSRFTDEGYLMFTLPVKTSHIFLSSALNMLIWGVIAIVVIIIAIAIPVVFGPVWPDDIIQEIKAAYTYMYSDTVQILGAGYTLSSVLYVIAMSMYSIVVPMSAVVLGASVAKKHKVLAIIGILIGISVVISTISSIISALSSILSITSDNIQLITTLPPVLNSIIFLGFTIGGYFLSVHLMKRRLTLP